MATTVFGWRPSALPAAHSPIAAAYVAGVRMINNSIGIPAATPAVALAAEGALGLGALAALTGSQRIDADKVKGFNARGNPPRGRRRV